MTGVAGKGTDLVSRVADCQEKGKGSKGSGEDCEGVDQYLFHHAYILEGLTGNLKRESFPPIPGGPRSFPTIPGILVSQPLPRWRVKSQVLLEGVSIPIHGFLLGSIFVTSI
jgi:hypothetical protein